MNVIPIQKPLRAGDRFENVESPLQAAAVLGESCQTKLASTVNLICGLRDLEIGHVFFASSAHS